MKPIGTIRSQERSDWDMNAEFYRRDERSELMRILADARAAFYDIPQGARVLDLGCGTGATVAELRARGVDAFGVDYSPAMIEAAVQEHGLEHHVTCGSVDELPFEDDSFDVMIADGLLHHLAVQGRMPQALREIHRVLRPGGTFCCFDRNGSLMSGLLLRFCIGIKSAIRFFTRSGHFSSSATRNEIPYGGRKDMAALVHHGFRLTRRRDVSTAPFFLSVVVLNVVQYFVSRRLRRVLEPKVARLMAWFEAHGNWHWLSVEQLTVFESQPRVLPSVARDSGFVLAQVDAQAEAVGAARALVI